MSTSDDGGRSIWNLGPAAKLLARPVTRAAACVICSRDAEADFLLSSWTRQHALLAVLDTVANEDGFAQPAVFAALLTDFKSLRPIRLVEKWYGCRADGLGAVFEKLGGERPSERHVYRGLVRLIGQAGLGAKTLRHASRVSFRDVQRLARLPDWLRTEDMCWMEPKLAAQIAAIGEALLSGGKCSSTEDFREMISSENFALDPFGALARRGIVFTFPEPPWSGDQRLRPVRNSDELAFTAQRFRNCLGDAAQQCMAGARVYYVWEGEPPAVVEIQNQHGLCWSVTTIAGIRNSSLSEAEQEFIESTLPLHSLNESLWRNTTDKETC